MPSIPVFIPPSFLLLIILKFSLQSPDLNLIIQNLIEGIKIAVQIKASGLATAGLSFAAEYLAKNESVFEILKFQLLCKITLNRKRAITTSCHIHTFLASSFFASINSPAARVSCPM